MQTIRALDLSAIPAAKRAAVLALMETVAALTEITRRQEHLIAELNHALHGKRSEKLTEFGLNNTHTVDFALKGGKLCRCDPQGFV